LHQKRVIEEEALTMAERGLASPERVTMQEELQRLFAFAERKLFARHMLGW
jgi:hypothetical protein